MAIVPPSSVSRSSAHAQLHAIVLLWGCTAILGRHISISAVPLVWYRLVLVVIAMAVLVPARRIPVRVPLRSALRYAIVGALIGVHWLCFYGAIKHAGVATAVITLSTIAFFTAVFEPIVFRRRVAVDELVIGAVVVVGVALLIQVELAVDALGLALGFASALFAAIFSTLNGRYTRDEIPERLMLYEMSAAAVVVSACFLVAPDQFVAPAALSGADLGWLVVLAIMCTVVPQVWILHVMRVLSPFTVAVSTNLEPVYALVLTAVLFPADEHLGLRFYLGAGILLSLVVINGVRKSLK